MKNYLVSINDIPPGGKEFIIDNQEVWEEPIKEFKMDCRIEKPLKFKIGIIPAEGGCLLRGELDGQVVLPCNRCMEDARISIHSHFDEFEEIPETAPKKKLPAETHIVFEKNFPMLNITAVAWEQFMLALPVNPLCREDCKGLCNQCGANLNNEHCNCSHDEGDPRLAVLRGLKMEK